MQQKGSVLGATLLVAGTAIGGGMLAFPVVTGNMGFWPAFALMLIGWAFMTTSALYLVEASLWMEEGAHIITMSSRLLGPLGKAFAWVLYLFISYASLVAYTAAGGEMMGSAFNLSDPPAFLIFVCLLGFIVYLGSVIVGRINALLMVGLVASYFFLIGGGLPFVKWPLLMRKNWGTSLMAAPLLMTIFSFQTIVPSLTIYLKKDGRAIRRSILYGTTGALFLYVIWQWLVLGTVLYDGDQGLAAALANGKPATQFLGSAVGKTWLGLAADLFAFFALVTSFLGIGLGLSDFLADGLKIQKRAWGAVVIALLVIVPTLLFAFTIENVFLRALDASGGIGDAILNCLFPALMVWVGRYRKNLMTKIAFLEGKG